jgi:multimeric flavodoxin WrbA
MLVLGIVGSPRKGGNTEILMKEALKVCQEEGLKTEFLHLADLRIDPCNECMVCKKERTCPIEDDFSPVYEKMLKADGILLGSPVFFSSATPSIKALIDRAGYLGIAQGRPFEKKVGGARQKGRPQFYICRTSFLFSLPRNDCARVDLLECWFWQRCGRSLTGRGRDKDYS